ncbi:MAG: DNA topoisomerase [Verrucomicrobia bacterium]|nr:MAG: DNA topoisomerase [Verrucomicrobiota bacterium]
MKRKRTIQDSLEFDFSGEPEPKKDRAKARPTPKSKPEPESAPAPKRSSKTGPRKKKRVHPAPVEPVEDLVETIPVEIETSGGDHGKKGAADGALLAGQYRDWFLQYASYVILDRAVPHLHDGLKPVQRRIQQTLFEIDDGRFHKVANIVGQTMALHPHGDASICAALVAMGQRGLLVEPQGNFGNPLTGDGAAASRYIEARLTPFAREVLFNPKTTVWQASYDGRKREPVTLPAKFPLLLVDGAEGIAVGLSTRILPHNFIELVDASVACLKEKPFQVLPDFPGGGRADFTAYNDGQRGSKVLVRARIEQRTKYVLAITELPFGTTTTSLIDSIISASGKGRIKVRHIDDNTAEKVEILVHLPQGTDTSNAIDQLFVFTDCQVTLSPNACLIENDKPLFTSVSEIIRRSTQRTVELLKQELQIRLAELEDKWHAESLERIFIEKRIYRRIEKSKTWEDVLIEIRTGLEPYLDRLRRPVTEEDIVRLTEIRIKRISAYNRFKANEHIKGLEKEMREVRRHLRKLTDYAIAWFTRLKEKYGQGRERRTVIETIQTVAAKKVALVTEKLYVNRKEGFIGTGLKKEEQVCECSTLDDVICFMMDGTMKVSRVGVKVFMGKDIIHVALFRKNNDSVYNLAYLDGGSGRTLAKRFRMPGITREKIYHLGRGNKGSKVHFFSIRKEDAPPLVKVKLSGRCRARIKEFEFDFSTLGVKGRGSAGNIVTKWPVLWIK